MLFSLNISVLHRVQTCITLFPSSWLSFRAIKIKLFPLHWVAFWYPSLWSSKFLTYIIFLPLEKFLLMCLIDKACCLQFLFVQVFISLEGCLLWVQNSGWQFCYCCWHFKMSLHYLLACILSDKKSACLPLWIKCPFPALLPLGCLGGFLLYFVFQNCDYDMPNCEYFAMYPALCSLSFSDLWFVVCH